MTIFECSSSWAALTTWHSMGTSETGWSTWTNVRRHYVSGQNLGVNRRTRMTMSSLPHIVYHEIDAMKRIQTRDEQR